MEINGIRIYASTHCVMEAPEPPYKRKRNKSTAKLQRAIKKRQKRGIVVSRPSIMRGIDPASPSGYVLIAHPSLMQKIKQQLQSGAGIANSATCYM